MVSQLIKTLARFEAYFNYFNSVTRVTETEQHVLTASSNTTSPTPCTVSVSDGASTKITYNTTMNAIQYVTTVPKGSYFSVGYGNSMTRTDMVVWEANGASSVQIDVYSTNHNTPATVTNTYTTTFI